jgi:acetyl esterase/lipase
MSAITSSSSARRGRRLAAGALLVAAGVAVGPWLTRRRGDIAQVSPDLRSPVLHLPLALKSDRVLRMVRSLPMPDMPVADGVTVERRTVPGGEHGNPAGVDVLVYEPSVRDRPSGVLLWMHGGGMILGTPEQAHPFVSRLAADLGIVVVSVDYRLAPEHPFPAGLEDCYAALTWLHGEADAVGVDSARVAVGGDSAGGGLAAALAQMSRDRGGPPVCFQLLEYPMLDDRTVLRERTGRPSFIWTPPSNRYAWTAYLGHPPSEAEERPWAAPARCQDLAGLAPAWVGVGSVDLFHDEDVDYAHRLRAAGVPCELHVEPGMYHGADAILPERPPSRDFRAAMTSALRAAMVPPPIGD